jgi:hypothetical protein
MQCFLNGQAYKFINDVLKDEVYWSMSLSFNVLSETRLIDERN